MYLLYNTSIRYEVMGVTSQRLVLGLFSIAPATGVVAPGQSQSITVDCIAERQGKHEEVWHLCMGWSER